jgi:hypothetical protein
MPKKILIIGEVFTDTHLDIIGQSGPLVRLGGVFHTARGLAALQLNSSIAYYAPSYLEPDIEKFGDVIGATIRHQLGIVDCAPNVMLISESTEAGSQGYCNILKDQAVYRQSGNLEALLEATNPTDIIILPGRYGTASLLRKLKGFQGKVHIDLHYDSDDILCEIPIPIETLIISTSSEFFQKQFGGTMGGIKTFFKTTDVQHFLLKENRGGAVCFSPHSDTVFESPAYISQTMHSVGVGDVYNAIYVAAPLGDAPEKNMRLASHCAALYASTMSFDLFKELTATLLENAADFLALDGVRLSWEERQNYNIYLAAPDFPDVDTTKLRQLTDCLKYHNFKPHLPIQENGLASHDLSSDEHNRIYHNDLSLLESCDLLIAVLLFNDPGTLVELGMFRQSGKPTIIYDPFGYCTNIFVKFTPNFLCHTINEVINATYCCLRRK